MLKALKGYSDAPGPNGTASERDKFIDRSVIRVDVPSETNLDVAHANGVLSKWIWFEAPKPLHNIVIDNKTSKERKLELHTNLTDTKTPDVLLAMQIPKGEYPIWEKKTIVNVHEGEDIAVRVYNDNAKIALSLRGDDLLITIK